MTTAPFCLSCKAHGRILKRLIVRESQKQEGRRAGSYAHKYKQRPKPIGWLCTNCGAMFTDEQKDKCRTKLYGSEEYRVSEDGTLKKIRQKHKPIEGLYDLTEEIQNEHHYFYHED